MAKAQKLLQSCNYGNLLLSKVVKDLQKLKKSSERNISSCLMKNINQQLLTKLKYLVLQAVNFSCSPHRYTKIVKKQNLPQLINHQKCSKNFLINLYQELFMHVDLPSIHHTKKQVKNYIFCSNKFVFLKAFFFFLLSRSNKIIAHIYIHYKSTRLFYFD